MIELIFKLSRTCDAKLVLYGEVSQESIVRLIAVIEAQKDTFPTEAELQETDRMLTVDDALGIARKFVMSHESHIAANVTDEERQHAIQRIGDALWSLKRWSKKRIEAA